MNFILRRSIRLDPPYWAAIAIAMLLVAASNLAVTDRELSLPSWQSVLAHVFYLQNVLGYGDIVDVFWSLCIEAQFYLLFVVLMGIVQSVSTDGKSFTGRSPLIAVPLFVSVSALSFAVNQGGLLPAKTWILTYWNEFFAGVLVSWILSGRLARNWFYLFGLVACTSSTYDWHPGQLAALATASIIFWAGERGGLKSGNTCAWLQAFGRGSYSFYLVHTLVLSRLTRVCVRMGMSSIASAIIVIGAGFFLSAAVAAFLYFVIERPCVQLSKRIRHVALAC